MVQRRKCSVQACVVIENCSRAVNIERGAEFLRSACKIDFLAAEMPIVIPEKMHVVAAFTTPSTSMRHSRTQSKRLLSKNLSALVFFHASAFLQARRVWPGREIRRRHAP